MIHFVKSNPIELMPLRLHDMHLISGKILNSIVLWINADTTKEILSPLFYFIKNLKKFWCISTNFWNRNDLTRMEI